MLYIKKKARRSLLEIQDDELPIKDRKKQNEQGYCTYLQ
jgi:hypothetical protein